MQVPVDFVLQPLFGLMAFCMRSTTVRVVLFSALLPAYLSKQIASAVPTAVRNITCLLSFKGRRSLVDKARDYRRHGRQVADQQTRGDFAFRREQVLPWNERSPWPKSSKYELLPVPVCGISARVLHSPAADRTRKPHSILLAHGNPSYSIIWRDIVPVLNAAGYDTFALDFLGHGTSDKPVDPSQITPELHMYTIRQVVQHLELRSFFVVAHDWGGCIALCALPGLLAGADASDDSVNCEGIFLVNSFLPPRPTDISPHYYLLYWIWFFSTGIFGPLVPESFVMRYMVPSMTRSTLDLYEMPFRPPSTESQSSVEAIKSSVDWQLRSKASIQRFAHIVPGLPDWVLFWLRDTTPWLLLEGLLGPERFCNVNVQASLAKRNEELRSWFGGHAASTKEPEKRQASATPTNGTGTPSLKVGVLFGQEDPLLKDFKTVLERTIPTGQPAEPARSIKFWPGDGNGWLAGAGHYPMEQKPKEVAEAILKYLAD